MCDHCVEADKHALSDQDILAVYDWSRTLTRKRTRNGANIDGAKASAKERKDPGSH